ncbi:hypothetical protein [Chitinophaga agri]|uniref:Uncharacterized protein n=1 Tax=Chitinophaga agri TaxID=2703787 RepID=A0A6B9ZI95_9BACT|nr:hypothetical protein [Chitinophaga agri]QHS61064.1 hypothetical protein GWR21_16090 [Chitinophaga agri]
MTKQTTNRHILKKIRSHSKEKLHNDPAFKKLRENWNDFTTAAKAAKLMRTVMESIQIPVHDRKRHTTLTKIFKALLHTDKESAPGQKRMAKTDLSKLGHVELNTGICFDELFSFVLGSIRTDRDTGEVDINVLYDNTDKKKPPVEDATHFELCIGLAEIDFEKGTHHLSTSTSGIKLITNKRKLDLHFDLEKPKESDNKWWCFFAVNFYNKRQRLKDCAIILFGVLDAQMKFALIVAPAPTASPQTQQLTES